MKVSGYTGGAEGKGGNASLAELAGETFSGKVTHGFGSRKSSLSLPIKETPPEWWTNDFSQWTIVTDFGATPSSPEKARDDDSLAIQQAIDSGKPLIFFPPGRYDVNNTVIVRGAVRKILGGRAWILAPHGNGVSPIVRIDPTDHDILEIEYIRIHGQQKGKEKHAGQSIEFNSPKTLVLRSPGGGLTNTARGTGDIFLEDYMAHLAIEHPVNLWARQINSEFGTNLVTNKGGTLWLFGYKIEVGQPYGTVLRNEKGKVELFGGQIYPLSMKPNGEPESAFVGIDSEWSLVFKVTGNWPVVVSETLDGKTREITREEIPNPAFYISTP